MIDHDELCDDCRILAGPALRKNGYGILLSAAQ